MIRLNAAWVRRIILISVISEAAMSAGVASSSAAAQVQISVGNNTTNCSCRTHRPPRKLHGTKNQKEPKKPAKQEPPLAPVPERPLPKPSQTPQIKASWEDTVIKAIVGGGLSLVSLAFAALTFLHGALLSLKDEDRKDPRVKTFKRRLALSIYVTAAAVAASTILTVLAFVALVTQSKNASIVTVCFAVMILIALSVVAAVLAYDIYEERHSLT